MARIFINNLNTRVGLLLLNELRPTVEGEKSDVKVIGTLDPSTPTPRPENIRKILHRHKPRLFRKYLLECGVIIYDLHTADLKEVEEKLTIFKTAKLEENKLIVLISSVMVWSETEEKTEKIEKVEEIPEQDELNKSDLNKSDLNRSGLDQSDHQEKVEEEVKIEIKKLPFEDSDFQSRVPHKDYVRWKQLEDLALSLASKENISVYVVCAGVLYGNGECIFEHHFKSAWLESPAKLPYLQSGENLIPTIHVRDLARITRYVVDSKPESKYIFAVDNTKDRRQLSIVQAISNGIGTGEVQSVQPTGAAWELFLSINLWVKPNNTLVPEEEGSPAIEWHALEGINGNIYKLNNEFNEKRGLRPIKVFISGPPASGKTHFSKLISEEYNVPHIRVNDLIQECIHRKSAFAETVQELVKKGHRIPDDLLAEIFRWKLHMNHCRNRGYVLDGYPRNYKEAHSLFMKAKKTEEPAGDEEAEPKAKEYELDSEILPKNVIVFRALTSFLMARIDRLKSASQEFGVERMSRRLGAYKEQNEIADKSAFDYFSDLNTEVFECECNDDEVEIIENLKIYIEREGRPHNFLSSVEEIIEKRRVFMQDRDLKRMNEILKKNELEQQLTEEAWDKRIEKAKKRFENIKEELQQAAKVQTIPLRKYLMDNIMPSLAEALIQVCKVKPDDPVDYVADLIYSHSKHRK